MKKKLSVIIALIIVAVSFSLPFNAYAEFADTVKGFTYNNYVIPAYDGDIYEVINSNEPAFDASELNQNIYESYGELDDLKRVTVCSANIDQSLMPAEDEKRGDIGSVKPTGWKQKSYDFVNNKWLYNRCHLIGWQLTAENANVNNLMTGTRTFNSVGMLKFENEVAKYVKADGENNVLYRATPVFQGDNLLASGVIMEAESVDDLGTSVKFCVFVYNVEKGVSIDYAKGENTESGTVNDISEAYVWLKNRKYTYTGKAIKALDYVKYNGAVLKEGRDYTVEYLNNTKIGTATVVINGIGIYSGTVQKTFTIERPLTPVTKIKSLKAGKKSFTVKFQKKSGITGYQLQYSTRKNFKKKTTLNLKSTTVNKTVNKLKGNKKYYVRIRTYKTVAGKKFYSKWYTKTVITKS